MKPSIKLIVASLIMVGALIMSIYLYYSRTAYFETWKSCEGVVYDIEKVTKRNASPKRRGHSTYYRVYYTFPLEDTVKYGYTDYSDPPETYVKGDSKTIWYDPANPDISSAHRPTADLYVWAPFFLCIPVSVGIAFKKERKNGALYSE